MPITHRYGWVKDRPDPRDHIFGVHAPGALPQVKLPPSVDLRDQMPPVYDQNPLNSCVYNAVGALIEYLQVKGGMPPVVPSRLFGYYCGREIEGDVDRDEGSSIRTGIKVATSIGAPPETLWPYLPTRVFDQPTPDVYAAAAPHRISAYQRLNQTVSHLRMALTMGFPVVFGITIYESFESDAVARSGAVPMPSRRERLLGRHAILGVGFNHPARVFLVRNSWGSGWGKAGYFTLPYDYAMSPRLASDFWTAQISS